MGSGKVLRVFLADDHPLLRIGLRLSLGQEEDIDLVGEASDGYSAVKRIQAKSPDVSLIDVDMPGMSGIKVIRMLRNAGFKTKLIVLSCYNDEDFIRDAMEAGADGYILKCVEVNELVRIIKSLSNGDKTLSPYLVNLSLAPEEDKEPADGEPRPSLTMREREILEYITEGKSNKEISHSLNISVETVKSHAKSIYSKLNVKSRVEAVKMAMNKSLPH